MAEHSPRAAGASDYCDECGTPYPDPHATHCSAHPDNLVDDEHPEACLWISRTGIQGEIAGAARANRAKVHPAGQWGDPDAQAAVLTTTTAHGIVTVHHDDIAEAIAHDTAALVYAYPARPRRQDESIADYATAAMLTPDGANRTPVQVTRPSLTEAIGHALAHLSD
jgi:hypothetical protein